MQPLISLIVYVVIFAIIAYGAWWICTQFGLPRPVFWIVGALLLICLLLFAANQIAGGGPLIPHLR